MMKRPSVSIVIPVYNEEGQLALCLEAIARQTVKPLEVIVVDNNSTDATMAIARRYPFVTVLRESRQGVVFARNRGFNAARGEIIGRLDGDSVIACNWVEKVQEIFARSSVDAVSGQITYRNFGLVKAVNAIDGVVRRYLTKHMSPAGEQFLYGVNMAIRKSAWVKVKSGLCAKRHLHEDIDLANHLSWLGCTVVFAPDLRASVEWRQAAAGPRQFLKYVWSGPAVYAEHNMKTVRYTNRVALFVSCLYIPIHLLYKGYNPATKRFSLACLLTGNATVRPSPVSDSL